MLCANMSGGERSRTVSLACTVLLHSAVGDRVWNVYVYSLMARGPQSSGSFVNIVD